MRIQYPVSIAALCFLSIMVTWCCSSPGYCQSVGQDKPQEQAQTAAASPSGAAPEDAQPHPGRDAPLWDKGGDRERPPLPMVTKMAEGLFRIGKVMINKREGLVTIQGEVNMQEGLVEYLAVATRGKLHESVLKVEAEPYDIQIALLLLGLEPASKPLQHQGDPAKPEGDPVELWVTWSDKDKRFVKHRGEELIFDRSANKPMEQTHWVFSGSQVINGRFMAAVEHSIVAVYHDPFAILDNPFESGGSDKVHFVNNEVTPPKGTPVNLVIKSLRQPPAMGPRPSMAPSPKGKGAAN